MPSNKELVSKVKDLSEVVVEVHNTLVTLLEYMHDNVELVDDEDNDNDLEIEMEDEDEEDDSCSKCGK